VPSTATNRPVSTTGSEWSELAFDLTAIGLALTWLLGTGYVVLLGIGETLHFLGETATPEEVAESRRLFGLAAVLAVSVPLAGLLLCLGLRNQRFGVLFAVLLLVGGAFAGFVALDAYRNRTPDPVEPGPRVCQESSGGDNRCPGG
jgi:hypothetical protein